MTSLSAGIFGLAEIGGAVLSQKAEDPSDPRGDCGICRNCNLGGPCLGWPEEPKPTWQREGLHLATDGRRRYGVRFGLTWPHVSLGISAHLWPLKFAHLSFHLPFGWLTVGHVGLDGADG